MKRVAIIDLGTNTFHLLITEINGNISPGNVCKETIPVKLGEGGINQGLINPVAFRRGIQALEKFSNRISVHRANSVRAIATAAIRSARNGETFISEVKNRTGIDIEIIDGEKEADLIYKGVREAVKLSEEPALIMDIGGGSVEFILCNSTNVFFKKSYPLGAAKMMEQYHHSDPISMDEVKQFTRHLDETLIELVILCEEHPPRTLIGSAGAFETFEELVSRRFLPLKSKSTSSAPAKTINLDHFNKIEASLLKSTHKERSEMSGLIELRVDMIVIATILTKHIIETFGIRELILSDYSLKEGVLFEMLA